MSLLTPPSLAVPAEVAVVAPSGPVDPTRLERGVATIEGFGLTVRLMPHLLARSNSGMLAGTDHQRAEDFAAAMSAPGVGAVWCARGGHGATRIVDLIDWARIALSSPRWLVGSSDITALHEAMHQRVRWATLHGAMVATEVFAGDAPSFDTVASVQRALFNDCAGMTIQADEHFVIRPGTAHGQLIGGNLTVLCSTLGTSVSALARGRIVLLEEVSEPPYRVDRMLTQLMRAGWFTAVQGVVLGRFHHCGDVAPVLHERLAQLRVPVLGGFSIGHGAPQLSIPLGLDVTLDTASAQLRFDG